MGGSGSRLGAEAADKRPRWPVVPPHCHAQGRGCCRGRVSTARGAGAGQWHRCGVDAGMETAWRDLAALLTGTNSLQRSPGCRPRSKSPFTPRQDGTAAWTSRDRAGAPHTRCSHSLTLHMGCRGLTSALGLAQAEKDASERGSEHGPPDAWALLLEEVQQPLRNAPAPALRAGIPSPAVTPAEGGWTAGSEPRLCLCPCPPRALNFPQSKGLPPGE